MNIFKYRVLNHILFWILIFSFYTVIPSFSAKDVWYSIITNLTYIPFDIITTYIIISYFAPKYLFTRKNIPFILGLIATISLNIALGLFIKYNIHPLIGLKIYHRPLRIDLFYSMYSNFMIVGVALALKLLRHSHKISLGKSELEKRSVQSELGILRSQVNPHFLFNTLNNIDSLIYEDKDKASNAIFLLSRIMRYMLSESTEEKAMFDKEIEYIMDYLELAKLSFKDEDFLQFKMSGNKQGKMVPPLLFIPIIENAIKHSNKQSKSPGILVNFDISDNYIELRTTNFVKQRSNELTEKRSGTGLKNVEKRLKLLYPESFTFTHTIKNEVFTAYIKVPVL